MTAHILKTLQFYGVDGEKIVIKANSIVQIDLEHSIALYGSCHFDIFPHEYRVIC